MNCDHYRVFYYVAKFGSFTAAADHLCSSQPNLTRTVKHLEQQLGCALFTRSNRGVRLTPEGEKLYTYVSAAMEQLAMGEEELARERGLESGVVSIGASEVALRCFLLPVLRTFHARYPGIRLRIANHTTPQATAALRQGAVDLAVVSTPFDAPEQFRAVRLKRFREIPVCGAGLRALADAPIDLSELCRHPLVCLSPQTKTYELYARFFTEHGLRLSPDVEAATADQLLPMIQYDLGVGFVPEELAAEAISRGEVFPLTLRQMPPWREICMLRSSDHPMSLAVKAVERTIAAAALE